MGAPKGGDTSTATDSRNPLAGTFQRMGYRPAGIGDYAAQSMGYVPGGQGTKGAAGKQATTQTVLPRPTPVYENTGTKPWALK
jgi:hypothetical protein